MLGGAKHMSNEVSIITQAASGCVRGMITALAALVNGPAEAGGGGARARARATACLFYGHNFIYSCHNKTIFVHHNASGG